MRIGVPKEIKVHEYRVGMTPAGVAEAVHRGHDVLVETGAGLGIGVEDDAYTQAGAEIASDAQAVFAAADLIVKVKEPQAAERKMLRENQVLFTYLHLAPDPDQTRELLASGVTAVAYETVTDADGGLPLLRPMSQVAGRMAVQAGAHCLEKEAGGRGVLLSGVPGVAPGKVTVIGGGVVGANAALVALGMGADVTVLDKNLVAMRNLEHRMGSGLKTIYSNRHTLEEHVAAADLVIGAVLVPGAAAPKLITRDMIKTMKPGAALVDVAIDQGGCAETSKPTTHADPTFIVDGVVHYCVANMPGAVAHTSTYALSNATLPFVLALAGKGPAQAMADDPHLLAGLNVHKGKLTYRAVAEAQGLPFEDPRAALGA
jgi:alanine dehydrogenase